MENNDWKILFITLGTGLLPAGITLMIMEHFQYFIFGLIMTMIALLFIFCAIFIKSNDSYFWNYLQRMALFALNEAGRLPYPYEEINLQRFIDTISNGISCYYLPEKSKEIKDTLKKICIFHKKNQKNKVKRKRETYMKLWGYLRTFYQFRHESAFRNPNFNPKDLKRFY